MVFEKITRTYLFQIALIISSVLVRDIHLIAHLIPSKFTFLHSVSTFRKFYGPHRLKFDLNFQKPLSLKIFHTWGFCGLC